MSGDNAANYTDWWHLLKEEHDRNKKEHDRNKKAVKSKKINQKKTDIKLKAAAKGKGKEATAGNKGADVKAKRIQALIYAFFTPSISTVKRKTVD